jgi:Zn finger protein HypA/HybF involved in hydrogenase expression
MINQKEINDKGITLNCKHCKYSWNYMGNALYYTSCPRCKANVKIPIEEDKR